MNVSALDVFGALYTGCDGLVEVRHFPPGKNGKPTQVWFGPDQAAEWAATCKRLHTGRQLFWGVATRKDDTSGTADNCLQLPAVWLDIDTLTPDVERDLAMFPLQPSLTVASGHGRHAYWFLREPIDLTEAEAEPRVVRLLKGLTYTLHGDPSVCDIARVLRIPRSRNLKAAPIDTTILEFDADRRYNVSDFAEYVTFPQAPAAASPARTIGDGPILNGSRNAALHKIARSLHAQGLTFSAIHAALQALNVAACAEPLPEPEIIRLARHADRERDREDFQPARDSRPGLRVRRFSDVQVVPLRPLWDGYIYRGKLTLAAGPGEVGKTYGLCHIATQGSRGRPMPDGARVGTFSTLIVSAEDGADDTLLPRLHAMEADTDRIFVIDGEDAASFLLGRDLPALEDVITTHHIDCVVFDALNSFLGGRLDTSQDASIRSVLGPLVAMAQRLDVALVGVAHFGKSDQANVVHKILGSVGFANLARVVVGFTPDPETPGRSFMAVLKNNLAPRPAPLAYRILPTGRLQWESAAGLDLVSAFNAKPSRQAGATQAAVDWLSDLLTPLGTVGMPSADILEQGAQAGYRRDTLFEAKKALDIKARKLGFSGGWTWALEPDATGSRARGGCTSDASTLRENIKDLSKSREESTSDASGGSHPKSREESEESNPLHFADASTGRDGLPL